MRKRRSRSSRPAKHDKRKAATKNSAIKSIEDLMKPWCAPGHLWVPEAWLDPTDKIVPHTPRGTVTGFKKPAGRLVLTCHSFGDWDVTPPSETPEQISQWTEERFGREAKAFFNLEVEANIAERAKTDPKAVLHLAIRTEHIVERIVGLAQMGNKEAIRRLAELARVATRKLNALPVQAVRPIARKEVTWPIIDSPHPKLQERSALLTLQVGQACKIEIHSSAKWQWDEACRIAYSLLCWLGKWNRNQGNVLPPFTDDTAAEWWQHARKVFLLTYPEPQAVPELASLAYRSKRKSPRRVKQAVLDILKRRFVSMARPDTAPDR